MVRRALALAVVACLAAACSGEAQQVAFEEPSTSDATAGAIVEPTTSDATAGAIVEPTTSDATAAAIVEPTTSDAPVDGPVWFAVLGVSQRAPDFGDIVLVTEQRQLSARWRELGFENAVPGVDFTSQVVLLYTRPQDACPDDLVEMRLVSRTLEATWLRASSCEIPMIPTAFAVALHRGSLPERFVVVQTEDGFPEADAELAVALPLYTGPPPPPPPEPPRRMTDSELDAVFAGHALRRCVELPDFTTEPRLDGPLSDDEDVASAQEGRASFGLPTDEATVRTLLDREDVDWSLGIPVTAEEFSGVMSRNRPDFVQDFYERYVPAYAAGTWGFSLIDQPAGGVHVIGFTGDLDEHRRRFAEEYPDVPVRVVEAPARHAELEAAADALLEMELPPGRARILGYGAVAYLKIRLLDPTREALDAIAATVDPAIACIEPDRYGL